MRNVVFAILFVLLTQAAQADSPRPQRAAQPPAQRSCQSAAACSANTTTTINSGICTPIINNDRHGVSVGSTPPTDSGIPRTEGVCGAYSPPFYTPDTTFPAPAGSYFPPVPGQ